jgi:hypothetical protein
MECLVALLVVFVGVTVGCGRQPQTEGGKPVAAVATAPKPEAYHLVDPDKEGFAMVLEYQSLANDNDGNLVRGSISSFRVDGYPVELTSDTPTDSKIHTGPFGDVVIHTKAGGGGMISGMSEGAAAMVSVSGPPEKLTAGEPWDSPDHMHVLMTDSQLAQVHTWLQAQKAAGPPTAAKAGG